MLIDGGVYKTKRSVLCYLKRFINISMIIPTTAIQELQ